MNITKIKLQTLQVVSGLLFLILVNYGNAALPLKANYSIVTSHNCAGYQCEKSLYPRDKLDIKFKDIEQSQFKPLVEQHINNIQTKQTTYPGFASTILLKLPKGLADKALHCHKAKALKVNWNDSNQKSVILKYRHDCWQFKANHNSENRAHQKVERVEDVTYTVKITRTATSCGSANEALHPSKFECITKQDIDEAQFRKYTLLELEDIEENNYVRIKLEDEEQEFILLDIAETIDFNNDGSAGIQSTNGPDSNPGDNPTDEPQIGDGDNDPVDPDLGDEPVTDPVNEEPEVGDDVNEPVIEEPEIDDDVDEPITEESGADDDIDEHEDKHEYEHDDEHEDEHEYEHED